MFNRARRTRQGTALAVEYLFHMFFSAYSFSIASRRLCTRSIQTAGGSTKKLARIILSSRRCFTSLHGQSAASEATAAENSSSREVEADVSNYGMKASSVPTDTEQLTPTRSNHSPLIYPSVATGGDYAGYSATFDLTGKLIPIPEYLIPESLIEWGQTPSALEVIVSEDEPANVDDKKDEADTWKRHTVTILPETGCAIDNLETKKVVEEWQNILSDESVQVWIKKVLPNNLVVETVFGMLLSNSGKTIEDSHDDGEEKYRARMSLSIVVPDQDNQSHTLCSPVTIFLERQIDTTSSQGRIADGGGLDGRSVATMLGNRLRSCANFAETKVEGTWKAAEATKTSKDGGGFGETISYFPEYLTLSSIPSSSPGPFTIEMGKIHPVLGLRQVVRIAVDYMDKVSSSVASELGHFG